MAAMFTVTFATRNRSTFGNNFAAETVIAKDATEAIAKATKRLGPKMMRLEGGLFPSEVKLLGAET